MSEGPSELIERVNIAAKRFAEAKAAVVAEPSSSSSSSSSGAQEEEGWEYEVMNADDVLKSMVARKVEMQNTTMDLDTNRKFEMMQDEVSKLTEEFNRDKPTAGRQQQRRSCF